MESEADTGSGIDDHSLRLGPLVTGVLLGLMTLAMCFAFFFSGRDKHKQETTGFLLDPTLSR